MSISQICIEQHEKESKKLKKILIYSFAVSITAHILGIISLPYLFKEKKFVEADEPIEIVVIDEPEEEKPPTSEPSLKPEEISPTKQLQAVARVPQDTQTTLIEPPVIKPEITNPEPVAKPKLESPDIKPEVKEESPKNIENKPEESPEKPETPIPTNTIPENNDDSPPVISGESPSDETSPIDENPGSIASNQGNRTIEKPINSGPLKEDSGNTSGSSRIIADRGNTSSGSISSGDNQASPGLSNPGSFRNNSGSRTVQKPAPPKPKPKPKPTQGGGKCISNCGLSNANSYIRRNFDGRERRVTLTVSFNDNGKVTKVQINPSTGNSSYDSVIRRDARRLRFSKGKSGIRTFGFSIVETGSKKAREAEQRRKEQERRRREAEERKRKQEQAEKEKKNQSQPQPTRKPITPKPKTPPKPVTPPKTATPPKPKTPAKPATPPKPKTPPKPATPPSESNSPVE